MYLANAGFQFKHYPASFQFLYPIFLFQINCFTLHKNSLEPEVMGS